MSISDTLQEMAQAVEDAKDAIEAKGGSVGDTGLAGLASEIAGIPSGGGGDDPGESDWGIVRYYSGYEVKWMVSETTGVESYEIDQTMFQNFLTNNNIPIQPAKGCKCAATGGSWSVSVFIAGIGEGVPTFSATYSNFTELYNATGINITPDSFYSSVVLLYGGSVDVTSAVVTKELRNQAEYNSLYNSNTSAPSEVDCQIDGDTIPIKAIKEFYGGNNVTAIGDDLLNTSENLERVVLPPNATSIGSRFLAGCPNLDCDIVADNATSVGQEFCRGCTKLNSRVFLPKATSIGNNFLQSCTAFNTNLDLPEVLTIGNNFLNNCTGFNSNVYLPKVQTVGDVFGSSIKTSLLLPELTQVGDYFAPQMSPYVPKLRTIGNYFMVSSSNSAFNQPIDLPSVVTIGYRFLDGLRSFNSVITLGNSLTSIGDYFLAGCTSFDTQLNLPNSVTTIGKYFMSAYISGSTKVAGVYSKTIKLPSSLTAIGVASSTSKFMYGQGQSYTLDVGSLDPSVVKHNSSYVNDNLAALNSTDPAYVNGVTVVGAQRAAWISAFPNLSSTSAWRKLVDGGR